MHREHLQSTQQFTCVIIDRMAHRQKVSSELGEVAYYMKWMSIAKPGCVVGAISVPGKRKFIKTGNESSGYHLGRFWSPTAWK
ncbi:hypothetical protein ACTXT7_015677 [Hymenolepis weldensis]